MKAESKLTELISRCKCGVYLTVNKHRDYYESAAEAIQEMKETEQIDSEDEADFPFEEMIKRNTIIDLQFYPDTPVGSYTVYHYDLDAALDMALETLK